MTTYTLTPDGFLQAEDGNVLGRLVAIVVDETVPPLGTPFRGFTNVSSEDQAGCGSKRTSRKTKSGTAANEAAPQIPLELPGEAVTPRIKEERSAAVVAPEVREIWEHYLKAISSRKREPGNKDIRLIEKALELRGLTTVKHAISGLAASPFHNGQNEQAKKYLGIRYALSGNAQTGETAEERIDSMASGGKLAAAEDSSFRSRTGPMEGRFNALKATVTAAWRAPDRPPATRGALEDRDRAISELREFGVQVSFREDGWPVFEDIQ